jgi:hypothetical protein
MRTEGSTQTLEIEEDDPRYADDTSVCESCGDTGYEICRSVEFYADGWCRHCDAVVEQHPKEWLCETCQP